MAEAVPVSMVEDVETAVRFLCRILKGQKIEHHRVDQFGQSLLRVLCQRYEGHWYPDKPVKGQAYRCIRINRNSPVDESLLKACEEAGIEYSELHMPPEFTMWVDPGDVSCRLSEDSDPFQVGDEYRSGKSSPDTPTSGYHSSPPPESASDEETQNTSRERSQRVMMVPQDDRPQGEMMIPQNVRPQGGIMVPQDVRPQGGMMVLQDVRPQRGMMVPEDDIPWLRSTTQVSGFWMPSLLWIPCDPNMLPYVFHQSAVLYYINAPWRAPTTRSRRPDPNLTKRLTKRACRK